MAAFDMADSKSVVSPGGVGFDINCGVRLLRTNLMEKDILPVKVGFIIIVLLMRFCVVLTSFYLLKLILIKSDVRNSQSCSYRR